MGIVVCQSFCHFFAVLATLRNEHDHATLMALVKQNLTVTDPIELEYASILTPYALRYYSLLLLGFFHIMIAIIVDLCLSKIS